MYYENVIFVFYTCDNWVLFLLSSNGVKWDSVKHKTKNPKLLLRKKEIRLLDIPKAAGLIFSESGAYIHLQMVRTTTVRGSTLIII